MSPDNGPISGPTIFSAVLTPNRSLSGRGFVVLMIIFGAANFASGLVFLTAGAWPVVGFLGLDVLLLYWAFRVNNRRARAYEQVIVTPIDLIIRKVGPAGELQEWKFNTRWVRLDQDIHAEFGLQDLGLISHGRRVPIASCLGAGEKESFARALIVALGEARRATPRSAAT
jgi:uncharacterized membrane protein